MNWRMLFDERQLKEIEFSQLYTDKFHHGTDGHNAKVIISKLAGLLDDIEQSINKNMGDSATGVIERIKSLTV